MCIDLEFRAARISVIAVAPGHDGTILVLRDNHKAVFWKHCDLWKGWFGEWPPIHAYWFPNAISQSVNLLKIHYTETVSPARFPDHDQSAIGQSDKRRGGRRSPFPHQ